MIVTPAEALASVARPPAARDRLTLSQLAQGFLRWLEAHHRPETTIASYGDGLGAFLTFATGVGMEYPDQVTVLSLDGYYLWLRSRGKSASTMAHRRSVLVSFWKWLEHEGFADRNVPGKTYPIKTPKRIPKYLEPHQIDRFLALLAALEDLAGQRDHAVVATFFYAGLRVSELATLRLADVDLVASRIRVNQGKGGRDRVLFVPPRLRPILERYVADVRPRLVDRRVGNARPQDGRWRADFYTNGKRQQRYVATREEALAILEREAPQPQDGGWFFVNAHLSNTHRLNPRHGSLITRSWYMVIARRGAPRRQAVAASPAPHVRDVSALSRRPARDDPAHPRPRGYSDDDDLRPHTAEAARGRDWEDLRMTPAVYNAALGG